ncbi:MAG: cell division FtsA domain-containing protein, partial [Candidatus Zixiibacteriota bacterium]
EILSLTLQELKKSSHFDLLATGIVLTGGGSLMEGVVELAERIFDVPVRTGKPTGVSGLEEKVSNPIYSTGVGLILYGWEQFKEGSSGGRLKAKGLFRKVKNMLTQYL